MKLIGIKFATIADIDRVETLGGRIFLTACVHGFMVYIHVVKYILLSLMVQNKCFSCVAMVNHLLRNGVAFQILACTVGKNGWFIVGKTGLGC